MRMPGALCFFIVPTHARDICRSCCILTSVTLVPAVTNRRRMAVGQRSSNDYEKFSWLSLGHGYHDYAVGASILDDM